MLFAILAYAFVKYGGAFLLGKLTVHRGMFHSIPALLIASELTFLGYHSEEMRVRVLMAVGVGIGFLSHLVLDEMYSVQWDGMKVRLASSAGTAMKFFGPEALTKRHHHGTVALSELCDSCGGRHCSRSQQGPGS
jgi:hypothetical protein